MKKFQNIMTFIVGFRNGTHWSCFFSTKRYFALIRFFCKGIEMIYEKV